MAQSRRLSFRPSSGRSRRKTAWELGPKSGVGGDPQVISTTAAQLGGLVGAVQLDGLTLVRTRGEFLAQLITAADLQDGFHGALGIAVVSTAAITAGVASVPTPITEEAWDGWLYHRYFNLFSSGAIAAASVSKETSGPEAVAAAVRFEVDSKAMRKLEIDMTIYSVVEVTEVGSASMQWAFNSRTLVKLP